MSEEIPQQSIHDRNWSMPFVGDMGKYYLAYKSIEGCFTGPGSPRPITDVFREIIEFMSTAQSGSPEAMTNLVKLRGKQDELKNDEELNGLLRESNMKGFMEALERKLKA